MIKAVFFDVDGTLVSHAKNEVSASTRSAVCRLRENDIKCVVATGRHLMELSELPVKDMDFDGYITLNGQLCLDDKKTVFHSVPIPGTEKQCILSLFEQNRIPVMLVEKDAMYINFINERVQQAQQAISTALPDVGSYTGAEIYQAIAFIDKSEEDQLKESLPGCKITRWNDYAVDIISSHGGKMEGIKQYLELNHISEHETMSFGDGENDIEMLRFTEIGVAMGNAETDVKACAGHITSDVDKDGIENALKHYGILK